MILFRSLVSTFRQLEVPTGKPVLVHSSLSAFGEVQGGANTVLGALLACYPTVLMPAFTFKTMLIPEIGPDKNGLVYGSGKDSNRMAEFFRPDMPVDKLIGVIPEALRENPKAHRSNHPILSFVGINTEAALQAQTIENPLAPIGTLADQDGWVILLGVDHTVNTTIHYAERLAGRRQFVRWALTPEGVVECPGFPGCSNGFSVLEQPLQKVTRQVKAGNAVIKAMPIRAILDAVKTILAKDPLALLCTQTDCERCQDFRKK